VVKSRPISADESRASPSANKPSSKNADDGSGNRLSGYLLDLPIDEPDPLELLRAVRHSMAMNKATGPMRGPGAFPLLASLVPSIVHRLVGPIAAPLSSRLFNTVVTSVPLPDLPIVLAGARLSEVYPVVPLAAGQALGIAVTAYRRAVQVGLHADHATMFDLDRLGQDLIVELAALAAL